MLKITLVLEKHTLEKFFFAAGLVEAHPTPKQTWFSSWFHLCLAPLPIMLFTREPVKINTRPTSFPRECYGWPKARLSELLLPRASNPPTPSQASSHLGGLGPMHNPVFSSSP